MKPAVAITLIIVGAILIALPPISDYLWRADTIRLLQKPGVSNVQLQGQMGDDYRAACFLAGAVVIAVACIFSIRRPQP